TVVSRLGGGFLYYAVDFWDVQVGSRFPQVGQRVRDLTLHNFVVRPIPERSHAGEQLEQQNAERVDIDARVDVLPQGLLGRHVVDGSEDVSLDGKPRRLLPDELSDSKVQDLHVETVRPLAHHHILRLEVAVDHTFAMRVPEYIRNLQRDLDGLGDGQPVPLN